MPKEPAKKHASSTVDAAAAPTEVNNGEEEKRHAEDEDHEEITDILVEITPRQHQEKLKHFLYGKMPDVKTVKGITTDCPNKSMQVKSYDFWARSEQLRDVRLARVALFQHQLPLPPNAPIRTQLEALLEMASEVITLAVSAGCDIFCFPEFWNMPYVFCSPSKDHWVEYSESAASGRTIRYLRNIARLYKIVIISPIMERDDSTGLLYSTAVIIDREGYILGKHRKLHIPKMEGCSESNYFVEGEHEHVVYETHVGNIAVNMCDGRHQPLNWLMFALNGADIVFNPCACSGGIEEAMWQIEARNAAFQNSYYVCAVNRVGEEVIRDAATNNRYRQTFFGSTYVAAPNGTRCPSLSSKKKGLLLVEMDINLCRQSKDHWGLQAGRRLGQYAIALTMASAPNFIPQVQHRPIPPWYSTNSSANYPENPANPDNYSVGRGNSANNYANPGNSANNYAGPAYPVNNSGPTQ